MALIYVVEDDDNIREIETIALKNSNYLVKAFARATDFYRALNDILPDLVLLDVMLPDENGCDIVRRLRSQSATKRLPVIMVTAKTSEMDMVKGLDDGADDYIKKPFSVLELLSRVKTSPFFMLQKDSLIEHWPRRRDLTSVPASSMPHSKVSSTK